MSTHTDAAAALVSVHNAKLTAEQALAAVQAEDAEEAPAL